jgi:hypothetical protein
VLQYSGPGDDAGFLYVVRHGSGVSANWTDEASVFMQRKNQLVQVFNVAVASNENPHPSKVDYTYDYIIWYEQGYPNRDAYRWDEKQFKFVHYGPAQDSK